MVTVTLAKDPFDAASWTLHEVEDLRDFIMAEFPGEMPAHLRIYHEQVADSCDVTPHTQREIDALATMPGPFYVVNYPGGIEVIIIAVVAVVAVAAAAFLLMPAIPSGTGKNVKNSSPNNDLSARTNQARPLGRIPDIFGQVRSTPDMNGLPLTVFEDHIEKEISFMTVGRGEHEISDIRDDTTPLAQIDGSSVAIYKPYESPLNGATAQYTIGSPILYEPVNVIRSNAVNGQSLKPITGDGSSGSLLGIGWTFQYPAKTITCTHEEQVCTYDAETHSTVCDMVPVNLADYFSAGDTIEVTVPSHSQESQTVTLSGTYEVASVAGNVMTLTDPQLVDSDWLLIDNMTGDTTTQITGDIVGASDDEGIIGPFILDMPDLTTVICNFVAPQGLYKVSDDGDQRTLELNVVVSIEPVNESGTPTGAAETFNQTITGSAKNRDLKAMTIVCTPSFTGRCRVSAYRSTPAFPVGSTQEVEELKWRDLYGTAPIFADSVDVEDRHFGNVTTVMSQTVATPAALALKDRKLNMLATRKVPQRISGSDFTTELYATTRADEIFSFICLDPYIGGRVAGEVDFDSIYSAIAENNVYFGIDETTEFSYTFDKDNLSFEETAQAVASAVFCTAYRRGSVIKLLFEKATEDSTLIFNHRNKIPGSEKRTITFGRPDDVDGVTYEYTDPEDDSVATIYIPSDQSAVKPRRVESVGVRNPEQATIHANRIWNKIRYQHVNVEFEGTQEAEIAVLTERVLVSDNTRPHTQDGEVLDQDGLLLTLSQDVTFAGGVDYTIFLQHIDGTVQPVAITAGPDPDQVVLADPPYSPLALGDNLFARATYVIVGDNEPQPTAFLITEKDPQSSLTSIVKAINYDARYYQDDLEFA